MPRTPFDVAYNIVNQLADQWNVPVDVRQATNDHSWEFAAKLIDDFMVSARPEITHMIADGQTVTSCCGRTPLELPRSERITVDPSLRNCNPKDVDVRMTRPTAPDWGGEETDEGTQILHQAWDSTEGELRLWVGPYSGGLNEGWALTVDGTGLDVVMRCTADQVVEWAKNVAFAVADSRAFASMAAPRPPGAGATCLCGHGPVEHTVWGKGPCEYWYRDHNGRELRERPSGVVIRCACRSFEVKP